MDNTKKKLTKAEFEARARFRRQLRSFEQFGENLAARYGITLAQYQVLLQIKGMPGRSWALVGEIAAALLLKHHTGVELVGRCVAAGLVRRENDPDDQRKVRVFLTPAGDRKVNAIAMRNREELDRLLDHIRQAVGGEAGDTSGDEASAEPADEADGEPGDEAGEAPAR